MGCTLRGAPWMTLNLQYCFHVSIKNERIHLLDFNFREFVLICRLSKIYLIDMLPFACIFTGLFWRENMLPTLSGLLNSIHSSIQGDQIIIFCIISFQFLCGFLLFLCKDELHNILPLAFLTLQTTMVTGLDLIRASLLTARRLWIIVQAQNTLVSKITTCHINWSTLICWASLNIELAPCMLLMECRLPPQYNLGIQNYHLTMLYVLR